MSTELSYLLMKCIHLDVPFDLLDQIDFSERRTMVEHWLNEFVRVNNRG